MPTDTYTPAQQQLLDDARDPRDREIIERAIAAWNDATTNRVSALSLLIVGDRGSVTYLREFCEAMGADPFTAHVLIAEAHGRPELADEAIGWAKTVRAHADSQAARIRAVADWCLATIAADPDSPEAATARTVLALQRGKRPEDGPNGDYPPVALVHLTDDLADDDCPTDRELARTTYLVLHRTLLQSMPASWQRPFWALVQQLRAAFAHLEQPEAYRVDAGERRELQHLTDEELALTQIIRDQHTMEEHGDSDVHFYSDRTGDELDPHDMVVVPTRETIPGPDRGRTRVTPKLTR